MTTMLALRSGPMPCGVMLQVCNGWDQCLAATARISAWSRPHMPAHHRMHSATSAMPDSVVSSLAL